MFDKELTEIVLKYKEDELQDLQGQQPVDQQKVDDLTKEINYIKATLVRYEIAVLLKLDKDENYNAKNFLGIEEEDVNNFNLTPDELNRYNILISQLPQEQLQRYKIRKRMSDILGANVDVIYNTEDFFGIENTNPTLSKYNLTQEQINEFNDLINQMKSIADDTTKSVNIKQESVRILEDAFNKINIEDVDIYNQIKTPYLETIDKLYAKIEEEKRQSMFTDVSNYELALELKKKYPTVSIKLDLKAVEKLLKKLEYEQIPEDKYNEYLDLLCNNINLLYNDSSNKDAIEKLLKDIDPDNYILRNQLSSRLTNINNVNFELLDYELEKAVKYLDRNYDSLTEKERNAYYNLVESKIAKDSGDLKKVHFINNLLLSISNKNLSEKLHSKFSKNENLKFNNQHLSSYQLLIEEQIKKLQSKIIKYEGRNPSKGFTSAHNDIKIREIEKEIEELKALQADYENKVSLKRLDEKYNKKTDKIIELKQEIAELSALKAQITSRFHQRIIDKKIEKRQRKISKLQESKVKIIGSQKRIMTPKLWLNRKKNMINRHFESKVETYQEYSDNYAKMAQTERQLGGMFSGLKAMFYEHKANKYARKAQFNLMICDVLNKSKVTVKGANQKVMNQQQVKQARQKYQQQQQQVATI